MTTLEEAVRRVKLVADGGTINGTYKKLPMAALVAFRADLSLLIDTIINEGGAK